MIAYISGILAEDNGNSIVVDAGGIGYLIFVPPGGTPYTGIGEEIKIYTYLSVTQDGMTLYGVYSKEALDLFKQLITVSGIGPKGALGILSVLPPEELLYAIVTEDDAAISRAPGIGKKTARKVILELKDRIDANSVLAKEVGIEIEHAGETAQEGPVKEAIMAQISLGYSAQEAKSALRSAGVTEEMDVESILKAALRYL